MPISHQPSRHDRSRKPRPTEKSRNPNPRAWNPRCRRAEPQARCRGPATDQRRHDHQHGAGEKCRDYPNGTTRCITSSLRLRGDRRKSNASNPGFEAVIAEPPDASLPSPFLPASSVTSMPKNLTPAMRAHLMRRRRGSLRSGGSRGRTAHSSSSPTTTGTSCLTATPTGRMPASSARRSGAMPGSRSTISTWSECSPRAASWGTRCAPACSTAPRSGLVRQLAGSRWPWRDSAAARHAGRDAPHVAGLLPRRAAGPVAAARPEHARGVQPELPGRPRR